MIVENLNVTRSWELTRENTEPETRDVERTPGSEPTVRTRIDDGSRGAPPVRPARRHRKRRRAPERPMASAYEVDIGAEEPASLPPAGPRAPLRNGEARYVDVET